MGSAEQIGQVSKKDSYRAGKIDTAPGSIDGKVDQTVTTEPEDRVDKVRDILFGAQREEYDRRFNRLEELLVKSISDLNNDNTKKLSALRDEYDKRFARLEELLVKNISNLTDDTAKKLSILRSEYDKRLVSMEELLVKNIEDLSNYTENKLIILKNDIQLLDNGKVDKAAVSKLLEELLKINNELNSVNTENTVDE